MKKKIVSLLLASALVFSMTGCIQIETSEEPSKKQEEVKENNREEDYATKENPADIRSKQTIEGVWGTFSFKLDNSYLGDDAISKLTEMGEDKDMVLSFVSSEEGYKAVLLEYTVSADKGFEEEPFAAYEILGNDLWDTEYKSKYDYYYTDLYENAGLDVINLTLKTGEESKAYILYALPESVQSFANCVSGENRDYWFVYNL